MSSTATPLPPPQTTTAVQQQQQEQQQLLLLQQQQASSNAARQIVVPVSNPDDSRADKLQQAVSLISTDSFGRTLSAPCVKDSFMYGSSIAFGTGVLRYFYRGNPVSALSWALLAFPLSSFAIREACLYSRKSKFDQVRADMLNKSNNNNDNRNDAV
ncbi:hypothetical protein GQ42DRAFT_165041 [Ramicandelaber brevisporus]|nr:hypothetical protein GQ42DRAFT_165041 [Ramicandelaber brevisporus]